MEGTDVESSISSNKIKENIIINELSSIKESYSFEISAESLTGVIENDDYSLKDNEYLYPSEENYPKVQYFHDIPEETRMYYERLWEDVKLH